MIDCVEKLQGELSNHVIFETVVGSQAYGTATPDSDVDIKGIYVLPESEYLKLGEPPKQLSDKRNDTVYYSLRRFMELALTANPNIIELLFMPQECVRKQTPLMDLLIEVRDLFVTKMACESHVGYATAQIKKARGRNKWVNNPQPKKIPAVEDFCWFIPHRENEASYPFRPVPLVECGIKLEECHVASLEHVQDVFRLYYYGQEARGVFRNGNLACESIPKADEKSRCIGLLIYNKSAYERAKRDHKNYWEWRRNRNEQRWQSQEKGVMDYDAKNMMHTFRLLLSGENILRHGAPIVRFEGEKQQFLMDIRNGIFTYDDLMKQVEEKVEQLAELKESSSLPEKPDYGKAEALLIKITKEWERIYA